MEELEARFLLSASAVFNAEQQNRILNKFEKALNFFKNEDEAKSWLGKDLWVQFQKRSDRLTYEQTFTQLRDNGVSYLLKEDPIYPPHFHHLSCPPHLLYYRGQWPDNYSYGISIIGSRRPTLYGRQMAQLFATELASQNMTIISGLAKGIDAVALESAAQIQGKTLAFLGTGIDRIYPKQNEKLFHKVEKHGALATEFPPGAAPLKHHFPWRNRLISAIGLGVLVVEAGLPSGTLGTVKWALDQGKECFAIPGPANSDASRGNHQMIRDGAHLIERPEEILDFFAELHQAHCPPQQNQSLIPSTEFHDLDNPLGLSYEPTPIELIMEKTGKSYKELTRELNQGIVNGQVVRFPGECYALRKKEDA